MYIFQYGNCSIKSFIQTSYHCHYPFKINTLTINSMTTGFECRTFVFTSIFTVQYCYSYFRQKNLSMSVTKNGSILPLYCRCFGSVPIRRTETLMNGQQTYNLMFEITFAMDLRDTDRKNVWLGFISCHEWATYYTDTLAVAFVSCNKTFLIQWTEITAQTGDSIHYFLAMKPCNWNI